MKENNGKRERNRERGEGGREAKEILSAKESSTHCTYSLIHDASH